MKYLKMMSVLILALTMVNCSDDDDPKPPTVAIFADVNGTEVSFTSETSNVHTYSWNFGDGNSSTEKNPVHAYEKPGIYKVILNVEGDGGIVASAPKDVEILESTEYLLSGGAAHPEGKTWKMKYEVSNPVGLEGAGLVDNSLGLLAVIDEDGFLDWINLSGGYDDSYTFTYDGDYKINNADGNSLMSLIYASLNYQPNIVAISTELDVAPIADVTYVPKADATWAVSTDDFTVSAFNPVTQTAGDVTFTGKARLVLDEYFGLKDAEIIVVIKEISETEMTVAIAVNAVLAVSDKPSHMFHLTFEAVPF